MSLRARWLIRLVYRKELIYYELDDSIISVTGFKAEGAAGDDGAEAEREQRGVKNKRER